MDATFALSLENQLTTFIVSLVFVPEENVTYPSVLLAANIALRNGPHKSGQGFVFLVYREECAGMFRSHDRLPVPAIYLSALRFLGLI